MLFLKKRLFLPEMKHPNSDPLDHIFRYFSKGHPNQLSSEVKKASCPHFIEFFEVNSVDLDGLLR